MAATPGILALTCVLLLLGPFAKSAQFPFHEWLPEAMSGPTPVSALIHAATMVKAGVYLIARMLPIFFFAAWVATPAYPEALTFFILAAAIGAFTAFLGGTQAIVAKELKKALAYSTMSAIGYMVLALGIAGLSADSLGSRNFFSNLFPNQPWYLQSGAFPLRRSSYPRLRLYLPQSHEPLTKKDAFHMGFHVDRRISAYGCFSTLGLLE